MLIKAADDRSHDIDTLQSLLDRPGLRSDTRAQIEQEIRNIRAGAKGESEAAYEIEFYLKASRKWAVSTTFGLNSMAAWPRSITC